MGYPSEEQARRNQWQDEYEASTREHAWNSGNSEQFIEPFDDTDIPADIKHAFEE